MIPALNVKKLRLDMGEYVLSVQALHARVGGRERLAGVDVDVKRGSLVALTGPAGAGKSLVLACIAGAHRASTGRVRYFGYELCGRAEERIVRMGIARTHQTAQLFHGMTVAESVMVGALLRRPRLARARAHAAELLALTGLADRSSAGVDGLDTSGRVRLEIARALATDPQLLLLDDPWAGLDESECASLTAVLRALRERKLTILAATRSVDRLSTLADDVVEIDRGTTAGTGAHAAVDLHA